VSGNNPAGWIDRIVGWCFGILAAAVALYCAVAVIDSILPALVIAVGTLALIGIVVGAVIVIRTARNRW
jgi:hypothetical protein